MDQVASWLIGIGTIIFAVAAVWFLVIAARTRWWWPPLFVLIVPVVVFICKHRRKLKRVGVLYLASTVFAFSGMLVAGDLIHDRHPNEPMTRTFMQKAYGCSGAELWGTLLKNDQEPLTHWLSQYRFDAASMRRDMDIARHAAHVAALTYLPAAELQTAAAAMVPNAKVTTIARGDYQAIVIDAPEARFVGFRGTDNFRNWLANVKFAPTTTDWGAVHTGFNDGFHALWPHVEDALEASDDAGSPIWLTGHSLGGALAVLAAVRLTDANRNVAGVITFGQPPVGYRDFAEKWNERMAGRLLRFVNHVDTVAAITGPIALPRYALTQAGDVRYFDTTGTLHITSPPSLQRSRDILCGPSFESGAEFGAHGMRRYLQLVSRAATERVE